MFWEKYGGTGEGGGFFWKIREGKIPKYSGPLNGMVRIGGWNCKFHPILAQSFIYAFYYHFWIGADSCDFIVPKLLF